MLFLTHVVDRDLGGDKLPIGIWIMIISSRVRGAKNLILTVGILPSGKCRSYPISRWEYLTDANQGVGGQLYPDTRLITRGKDHTFPSSFLVSKAFIHLHFSSPQLQGHSHHQHQYQHHMFMFNFFKVWTTASLPFSDSLSKELLHNFLFSTTFPSSGS